ncbi:ATP-binding protein [Cohnella fermenti]|uniref:ATP-binding protein n=1 Tax=Cohnella fermenti TaxID=2565925 RepID=A0A4S4BPM6_9BACL|nr:ATP-binding protein [Cohnella fermenti]THF76865.1 ATP-binding protein [Cohnella fermenti]
MRQAKTRLVPLMSEWAKLSRVIDGFCEGNRLADSQRMDLLLVCEEWFTNIVVHGFEEAGIQPGHAPPVEVELALDDEDRVALVFRDGAGAFNPLERQDPDVGLGAEERQVGGLGIYLIKNKMDGCSYRRADGRNEFTMHIKACRRAEQGEANDGCNH